MNVDPLIRLLEALDPTPHLLARPEPNPPEDLVAEERPDPSSPELRRALDPKLPPPDPHGILRDWPSS